jgi:predicted N-formylglutamate amidohydrolase
MHGCAPWFHGHQRPWHAGLLYKRDRHLADILLHSLRADPNLVIGANEPYSVDDATDYTIPEHSEPRGLRQVGIQLRRNLIAEEAGQDEWAERLARALACASDALIE